MQSSTPMHIDLPPALDVVAGRSAACARVNDAGVIRVRCWGANDFGQQGMPSDALSRPPADVPGLPPGADEISMGYLTPCARFGGEVRCWGLDAYGESGPREAGSPCYANAAYPCSVAPRPIAGVDSARGISAGNAGVCAAQEGGVLCWGQNIFGELGQGSPDADEHSSAVAVPMVGESKVDRSGGHVCAYASDGLVKCWGTNVAGEVGVVGTTGCGNEACAPTPAFVVGLSGIVEVRAGYLFTLARSSDGTIWAWGNNSEGQLAHPVDQLSGTFEGCKSPFRCNPTPSRARVD